ncbi:MAG: glycosyltransferase [Candidatus Kariarchaeaceae archaeon]
MKKILYVTLQNPFDEKYGAGIRNNHIIKGLSQYHDLHVLLTSMKEAEWESFLNLAPLDPEKLHLLNEVSPNTSNNNFPVPYHYLPTLLGFNFFNKSFVNLIRNIKPDLVWYFHKYSLRSVGFPNITPFILDLDNVNWNLLNRTAKYQSGKDKFQTSIKSYLSLIEERILVRKSSITVISNPDERDKLPEHRKIITIENGFDFPENMGINKERNQRILFFGSLFYYPNLDGIRWFCNEIWPIISSKLPGIKLDIIGHVNNIEEIENIVDLGGITFHGFVENIDPFIRSNACLIVPLRIASGTRIKILESWAKGIPVVSTSIGAEGLGATNSQTLLTGDTPGEFANACIQILNDPDVGTQLAKNAFLYGKEKFKWDSIFPKIYSVTESVQLN